MSRKSPAVEAAFPICKELRCPVAAWGPKTVVVEMKDSGRLEDLKSRLAPLGFHFLPNEDSQAAGLYDFSLSPEPVGKENNQFCGQSVIHLPFLERYQYLFLFLISAFAFDGLSHQHQAATRRSALMLVSAVASLQTTKSAICHLARGWAKRYDAAMKLVRQIVSKSSLRGHRDDNFVPGGIAKRLLMVWPITREVASLSPSHDVEQRLQRDVVRVVRRRR
jgi:hypothetical protein